MKVCNHETTGYVRLIVRSALREDCDAVVPGEVVPHHREHLVIVDVREELAITRIAMAHNHVVVLAGLDRRGLALHVIDQNVLVAEDLLHDVVAIVQLRLTRPRHAYQNVSGNHRFRRELGSLALGLTRGEKPNENVAVLHGRLSGQDLLHILVALHGNNGGHELHEETHHLVLAEARGGADVVNLTRQVGGNHHRVHELVRVRRTDKHHRLVLRDALGVRHGDLYPVSAIRVAVPLKNVFTRIQYRQRSNLSMAVSPVVKYTKANTSVQPRATTDYAQRPPPTQGPTESNR